MADDESVIQRVLEAMGISTFSNVVLSPVSIPDMTDAELQARIELLNHCCSCGLAGTCSSCRERHQLQDERLRRRLEARDSLYNTTRHGMPPSGGSNVRPAMFDDGRLNQIKQDEPEGESFFFQNILSADRIFAFLHDPKTGKSYAVEKADGKRFEIKKYEVVNEYGSGKSLRLILSPVDKLPGEDEAKQAEREKDPAGHIRHVRKDEL